MKAKKQRRRKLARIYYGPSGAETSMWWTVAVTDIKKDIRPNGTIAAAMRAHPGETIGCALSEATQDDAENLGLNIYLASFTHSTALLVDRLAKDGTPSHALRASHNCGKLIDANDEGTLKALVAEKPEVIERPIILRPPRKRPTGPHSNHTRTATVRQAKVVHLHGALRRAVKAGRISRAAAEQLSRAMRKQKKDGT